MKQFFLLCIALSLVYSCGKDVEEINFAQIDTLTTQDITSIDSYDDELIAIGGEVFQQGVMLQGKDLNWITADSFSDKRLFGIDCNESNCTAVGQDGYYYVYTEQDGWSFIRLSEWDFQRAVSSTPNHGVTVSGKSFELGHIYHLTSEHIVDTVVNIAAQMQDVIALDDDTFIAVGYGTILRSTDGGYNWVHIDQEGDFYHSIDFVDDKQGIIVGQSGSILITEDGGVTWGIIKSPSSISANRAHFLSVKYINKTTIYIVGDEGLLWRSTDAGQSWDALKINTDHNLNDLAELDGKLYVVGDNGYMGVREL